MLGKPYSNYFIPVVIYVIIIIIKLGSGRFLPKLRTHLLPHTSDRIISRNNEYLVGLFFFCNDCNNIIMGRRGLRL